MDIIISNSSGIPIYEQIVTQIKEKIINGNLKEGDALPSMRYLAKELRISVITTKRAYDELELQGFIESCAGKGCFVKPKNIELLKEEMLKQIEILLIKVCEKAKLCNMSTDELCDILKIIHKGEN